MYLYENAIVDDINKIFKNSKVCAIIADSLNEGLRRVAAKNEDKITLPVIVLSGGDWQLEDINFYGMMHGLDQKLKRDEMVLKNTSVIPITPSYSMYIIAQTSRECDMLTREIIFHYSMNPTLTVNVPYGLNDIYTFNLALRNEVRKTSNQNGLVYRTINFTLQGAYLWHNNTIKFIDGIETTVKSKYDIPEEK